MNRNDADKLLAQYVSTVMRTQEAYRIWNDAGLTSRNIQHLYRDYTNSLANEGILFEQIILAMTGGTDGQTK